jgi:uncharacterized membrane protein YkvA (DUF1232 family)
MTSHSSHPPTPLFGAQLPWQIERAFDPLCSALASAEVPLVKAEVEGHVGAIRLASRRNEFLDMAAAEHIGALLTALLDQYQAYTTPHQALIAGAARYFVREQDVDPDTTSLLGLEDDVAVANFVLDAIDRSELKVRTDG